MAIVHAKNGRERNKNQKDTLRRSNATYNKGQKQHDFEYKFNGGAYFTVT